MNSSRLVLAFSLALAALSLLAFESTAQDTVQVTQRPAVQLSFATQPDKYYQVQVEKDGVWQDYGLAMVGTGSDFERLYPAGKYRVVTPSAKWVKVWADEFDGEALDTSKWSHEENNYGGGNNERQAYRTQRKYCHVADGVLNISVYRDAHTTVDGKTQPYSSARIRTLGNASWTYCRIEVRAKMPAGQGIWPAIWMLPTESPYGGWASSGEIDIVESRGSDVRRTTGALHFGGEWPHNKYLSHHYTFKDKDAAEAFHTYAIEWNEKEIRWFVDGELCQVRKRDEWYSTAARNNPSAPFDQPFHLIMNVAVDGAFFNGTDQRADNLPDDAFPMTMQVDYVRVYQWAR